MFLKIQQEYGTFDAYIWGFTAGKTIVERYDVRTTSPLSDRFGGDGEAYEKAIGVLNAHGKECGFCAQEPLMAAQEPDAFP